MLTDLSYQECLWAGPAPSKSLPPPPITTLTSFLPKFENDAEDMKKVHDLLLNYSEAGVLLTLKHSGSLLLVTGLEGKLATFSKNSTANDYTKIMDRILAATVPSDRRLPLADYLEGHNLSLSFEAVSPALMGDHGDRPRLPYLLLTSVHRGDSPLGLDQVIEIAARFSLIPNEMWWLPPVTASEEFNSRADILNGLSKKRGAEYSEAREYLDENARLVVSPPLRHSELQGEILEGFVVFVVEIPQDRLEGIAKLNEEFARCREGLRERLAALGARLVEEEQNGLPGPERLPEFLQWEGECGVTKESEVAEVLKILAEERGAVMFSRLPPEDVAVKFLKHSSRYFMILHVKKDDVFAKYYEKYGGQSGERLNRGHVFSLTPAPPRRQKTEDPMLFESQVTIRGTVKWKLLPYISRTFGNRNCLPALVGAKNRTKTAMTGYNPFMKAVERFFTNWRVDAAYCKLHREKMSDWARFVLTQNSLYKDQLRNGSYLTPFREFERMQKEGTLGEQQVKNEPVIIVIDLEPEINLLEGELPLKKGECLEPSVCYRTNKPTPGLGRLMSVQEPHFLLVAPDPPANAKRAISTTKACLRKQRLEAIVDPTPDHSRLRFLIGDEEEHFKISDDEGTMTVDGGEPIKIFSTFLDAKAFAEEKEVLDDSAKDLDGRQVRRVVATLCCPPGTGKSTILKGVAEKLGKKACVVSSDDFVGESARNSFEEAFIKSMADNQISIYDKNIPDGDGLARLMGRHVMGGPRISKRFAVEYIFIVPQMLTDLNIDVARSRIAQRSNEKGRNVLGVWFDAFEDVFSDYVRNCRRFLSEAQCMRGVFVTPKFYVDNCILDLVHEVAAFVENCSDPYILDTNAVVKTKYWCVELSPPPSESDLLEILSGTGYGVSDLVLKRLHVTLAFAPTRQQDQYWNDRQNTPMTVKVSGVAWDSSALALYLHPSFKIPLNLTKIPHITVALKGGARAVQSNAMLESEHERKELEMEFEGFVTRVVNDK
ncbi:hypothetical protein TrVE_jg7268 [Triparma verrucosa]|uniref:Uncharacterized protein n=1 Tax=Triparma verrucosa TaxID=1606542 RepID=A0A9W7F079_9STRA|nr:hypothetical protein TrVE_jg7268 [Triparma verrucosa]